MPTRRLVTRGGLAAGLGAVAGAWAASAREPQADVLSSAAPADAGLDAGRLEAAVQAMLAEHSASVLVARGGRLVVERYASSGPPPELEIASAAKSLVSVLVGMAIDDGRIRGVDQSAADFIPAWRGTPKAAITLRHLLSMTSGLDIEGLQVRNVAGDQFAINAAAPLKDAPGTRWLYATPTFHLLYHVVGAAVGEPFESYAQRRLLTPLGMTGVRWVTNTGAGARGPVTNYYTARCPARDLARFGLFARQGGVWNGRRLVSADYLRAAVSPSQTLNPAYGWLWWENREPGVGPEQQGAPRRRYPGAPHDLFAALGAGGQLVAVVPSLDLVMVRQGTAPGARALPDFVRGVCQATGFTGDAA